MTRWTILGLLILSLLLSSCAGAFRQSEEAKLRQELQRWESFSGSGIIEISAMGFSLRKPFSIFKSLEEIRLDVFEGGLFGANPSPLLSMYLGDYLAINAPVMPVLEALNLKDKIPAAALAVFSSVDYVMDTYGTEIIANKAIQRDGLSVNFKKNYHLESVVDKASGTRLEAKYGKRGELDTIEIKATKPISAKMIFDQVEYSRPEIVPLPKKDKTGQNLIDLLQGSGMKDILKGLWGD